MSFDGPCSVLRSSLHGFPFNNDTRLSRSQLHSQRHVRQQHQPGAAFALGLGSSRRTSAEKKESADPSLADPTTEHLSSVFTSGAGSGSAWDVADDSLPPLIDTPRLRSVSSLVLSSDGEECLSPTEPSMGIGKVRSTRDQSSGWNMLDGLASTLNPLASTPTSMVLPPMSTGMGPQRLQREPSFPPPGLPSGPPRPLSREPSFPPLQDPGMMLGSQDMVSDPVSHWRATPHMSDRNSSILGSNDTATPTGGTVGDSSGNGHNDHQLHRLPSGTIHDGHDRALSKDQWDPTVDGPGGAGRVGGGVGSEGLYPMPPSEPDRKPSFDQLALLIPGVPQRFNPPQTGKEEKSRSPESIKPTPAPRGRSTSRPEPGRRRKGEEGGRGSGRYGRHRGSSKIEDAPGSAGPPSTNGGPIDLAKKARREAAIKKYMYKRSRRKFANSIREASPSRSRPKAARIRPRRFGKFIKTVPDFIPVTAVVAENTGEGDQKARTEQPVNRMMHMAGSPRGAAGARGGFLTPIGGGSLERTSFQQQPQLSRAHPAIAVDACSVLDGYTSLWPTSSM